MKLFQHQIDGIEQIKKTNGVGAFFWDVGCGKTLAAIKVFEHYKTLDPALKMFVVCPVTLIESAWGEDIKKFSTLSYSNLRVSPDLEKDILIVNFETLISKKFAPTVAKIAAIQPLFGVIDESQRIKSYNAKTTKYMLALSRTFKYKLILTATPAPNSKLEYWPQIQFLRPGMLGKNFFSFRASFFCLKRGASVIPLAGLGRREMMMMMQRGYKFEMAPGAERILTERMAPYCQFVEKRDALDLPEEVDVVRAVEMTPEQAKAFKQMKTDLVAEIKNEQISVINALSKLMKLRQISAGFAYNSEGVAIEFSPNPKMNELCEIVEEIGPKRIIIFCQYRWEIEKICDIFKNRAVNLYSKTKDKDASISKFRELKDGILVAHPASAGVGLSFNECDYMIFYSMDYSYMNYYQCRGRIMRANKQNKATYIHIVAESSLDRIILGAVRNKENEDKVFRKIIGDFKPGVSAWAESRGSLSDLAS